MAKQDDYARYTIRVPKEIYVAIEKAAENSVRSVNAEIVQRLERSVAMDSTSYNKLTLDIPEKILDKLSLYALIYDQTVEDYARSVLEKDLDPLSDFESPKEFIKNLENEVENLSEELDRALMKANEWRTMFIAKQQNELGFGQLLKSTCQHILSYDSSIPAELHDFAKTIIATLSVTVEDVAAEITNPPSAASAEGSNNSDTKKRPRRKQKSET